MTNKKSQNALKLPKTLRERAEAFLQTKAAENPSLATEDVKALVQELSVHQMELEIQNEELRQAQVALADSRDQYADLYDFAPFGYVTLARDGTIFEANLTAATMLGVDRSELNQANYSKFLTRESADRFYVHSQHVFESEGKKTCEIELLKSGEVTRTFRLESVAVGPKTERRCRTAMIDITYPKAAEKIIQESEARLRKLNETLEQRVAEQTRDVRLLAEAISHLGEGVLITEDELEWPGPRIVFVNEAMCRITGYSADELIGQSPRILQGKDTDRKTLDRIKAELSSSNPCVVELINYRKDATPFNVELFITPLIDEQGHRTNFVSVNRDITERKRVREELRRSHELLEQRVKERTAELEEANKACEAATAVKSRFLAAASHDLRQPLQSVELYLSVLAEKLNRPEQREIYEKIRKPLTSMTELLNTLLDISRFETGKSIPSWQDFSIKTILRRIVVDNQEQAREKGLQIELADTDCVVHSDPVLLERVIENFVTNAIRYTNEGSIKVECWCGTHTAWIAVKDTGIGIPQEDLDAIFDAYYQLGNPMRDRRRGFGLGLSIVKHIVDLLGHRVKVRSTVGEGSTFSIEVPCGKETEKTTDSDMRTQSNQEGKQSGVILLVDDDPAIVDSMNMLLQSMGHQVCCASTGDEALSVIGTGIRPDIIVCDYRLPGNSGIEVVQKVRDATRQSLPAVILTGDTSVQEIREQNLSNCTVIYKPVEAGAFLNLMGKLVAGERYSASRKGS